MVSRWRRVMFMVIMIMHGRKSRLSPIASLTKWTARNFRRATMARSRVNGGSLLPPTGPPGGSEHKFSRGDDRRLSMFRFAQIWLMRHTAINEVPPHHRNDFDLWSCAGGCRVGRSDDARFRSRQKPGCHGRASSGILRGGPELVERRKRRMPAD